MPDIGLTVNGNMYTGWTSARVTRGIESVSGGFDLSVSERWQAGAAPWPIYEEDECSISVNGQTVLTGFVDKRSLGYGPEEHSFSVTGRDKTGALVDCSVFDKKWEFLDTPTLVLVKRLAEPFGVLVSLQSGLTLPSPPSKVSVDPGDTAFDAIERSCRKAGVLAISDGRGGLLLMRPGASRTTTALVEGQNILAASAEFDASSRFRRYVILGQHAGDEKWTGEPLTSIKGEATDSGVRRTTRVLVVRPEGNVTIAQAKMRAQWEATVRAARADAVSVTVQGWTQADGSIWPINALVHVESARIGVSGDLLISQAEYSAGESGTTTRLTLRRPDAFKPEPVVKPTGTWKEIERGV